MNHIYRVVFNHSLGVYQCVSELAKAGGKSSGRSATSLRQSGLVLSSLSVAIFAMGSAMSAQAVIYEGTPVTISGTTNTVVEPTEIIVGATTAGTLTVNDGGNVITPVTTLGLNVGSNGQLTIDNAFYGDTSSQLYVGRAGIGSMSVQNGSEVNLSNILIGKDSTGEGDLTVTGTGSSLIVQNTLNIGNQGKASASIENGATVQARWTELNGTKGELTVTGADSKLISDSHLVVGYYGNGNSTGVVTIADGGEIATNWVYLGTYNNAKGELTVTDRSSQLTASNIYLGWAGSSKGTLNIENDGRVQSQYISNNNSTGLATINFDKGILALTGDNQNLFSGFDANDVINLGAGGGTIDTNNFDVTVSNGAKITGLGSFTKQGSGTLTMNTATNKAWAGDTNISQGTLKLNGDYIMTDSEILTISDGGKLNTTGDMNVANALGSTSKVLVTGAGSQLNVADILKIGFQGKGSATVADGGLITAEEARIGYFEGTPTSNGELTVTGNGSTFNVKSLGVGFDGRGSASVIDAGLISAEKVYIGFEGAGTGKLTVTGDGSKLTVVNDVIVGNTGSGTLDISDGGQVTTKQIRRANNSMLSKINFDNGTLALTDDNLALFENFGSSTDAINLGAGGGTIDTNEFDIAVFNNAVIGGAGRLTKQGTGTLTMDTATNKAWTGGTTISQGTLQLTGDYIMADGEVLGVGLNNTDDTSPDNGKLIVTGVADLSLGRLRVDASQAVLASTGSPTWNGVITANSIDGKFVNTNNIDSNSPLVSFKANYTPTVVNLNMVKVVAPPVIDVPDVVIPPVFIPPVIVPPVIAPPVIAPPVVPPVVNTTFVQSVNSQRNQADLGLASVLDRAIDDRVTNGNNALADQLIISTLNFSESQLAGVANQLQPLAMGATNRIITDTNYAVSEALSTHQPLTATRNLWAQVIGSESDHDADNGVTGYDTQSYGAMVGLDLPISSNLNLGVAVSYSDTDIDTDNSALNHELNAKSWQVLGYGGYNINDATYINFHAGAGSSDVDGERRLQILNSPVANADYSVDTLQAGLGVNYRIGTALSNITPFAQVNYAQAKSDSYRETGAGVYNLTVDENRYESMRWTAGLKMSQALNPKIALTGQLAAAIENGDKYSDITAHFDALPDDKFTTIGQEVGREIGIASIGISYMPTASTTLSAGYRGEWRDNYEDQGANVALQVMF